MQFESRAQMLDLANILQGLNIKLNGLVLLTRDEYWHYPGLRSLNAQADFGGVVVNYFKAGLVSPCSGIQKHDGVGINEVRHKGVRTDLNSSEDLQG